MGSKMGNRDGGLGAQPRRDPSTLSSEFSNASFEYDNALVDYEDALASRDPVKRASADIRLTEAHRRLASARAALVAARGQGSASAVSFADLLSDPTQQLDPQRLVLASVLRYQAAPTMTASAPMVWTETKTSFQPMAPLVVAVSAYVDERLEESTAVAATA